MLVMRNEEPWLFDLTTSDTSGFVELGFLDESGGMVGDQAIAGIPKNYMIVKYDLKEYSDQAAL